MSHFQYELEQDIADLFNTNLGLTTFVGIVRQQTFDIEPAEGEVLYGTAATPFVSLTSTIPERFLPDASFTSLSNVERTITVGLVAAKHSYLADPEPYRLYRQEAMRLINLNRIRGAFTSDANSCVLTNVVRPRSQFEISAWHSHGRWISAFDCVFQTREAFSA